MTLLTFRDEDDELEHRYSNNANNKNVLYLPPKTSQYKLIVSPSLYGPTTDVLSAPDSSFMLILSGGTEKRKQFECTKIIIIINRKNCDEHSNGKTTSKHTSELWIFFCFFFFCWHFVQLPCGQQI